MRRPPAGRPPSSYGSNGPHGFARTGQFRAYPLFRARPGSVLTAPTTRELAAQMDHAEQNAPRPRARSRQMDAT